MPDQVPTADAFAAIVERDLVLDKFYSDRDSMAWHDRRSLLALVRAMRKELLKFESFDSVQDQRIAALLAITGALQ